MSTAPRPRRRQRRTKQSYEENCFTDTDSVSGFDLDENDYRMYQINNGEHTSAKGITQYWTWHGSKLEHYVLGPKDWDQFDPVYDFSVSMKQVREVRFAGLHVHLKMKDGYQDTIASFKRHTTLQRFVGDCSRLGIETVETSE